VKKDDGSSDLSFQAGYEEALRQFETAGNDSPDFVNPFAEDTDAYMGFHEGVYDLTQK
jgi:hypothetical protein